MRLWVEAGMPNLATTATQDSHGIGMRPGRRETAHKVSILVGPQEAATVFWQTVQPILRRRHHPHFGQIGHRVGKYEVPRSDGPKPERRIAGNPSGSGEPALNPAVRDRSLIAN